MVHDAEGLRCLIRRACDERGSVDLSLSHAYTGARAKTLRSFIINQKEISLDHYIVIAQKHK